MAQPELAPSPDSGPRTLDLIFPPPRRSPDTTSLRLSAELWRRMEGNSSLAAGPLEKRPLIRPRTSATFSPRRRKNIFMGRSRAGSDPSSGPRRTDENACLGPPSPLGEGKHSVYAPARVNGFASPRGSGCAGEPQRGDLTKPWLKARSMGTKPIPSPEGAEQFVSIAHVSLVVGNPVRA